MIKRERVNLFQLSFLPLPLLEGQIIWPAGNIDKGQWRIDQNQDIPKVLKGW